MKETKNDATDKVREYVRSHRNRELVRALNGTEAISKPLSQIAEELGLRPAVVCEALRACGWSQAIKDAEAAERTASSVRPATPMKKKPPRQQPKFNPHGWTE